MRKAMEGWACELVALFIFYCLGESAVRSFSGNALRRPQADCSSARPRSRVSAALSAVWAPVNGGLYGRPKASKDRTHGQRGYDIANKIQGENGLLSPVLQLSPVLHPVLQIIFEGRRSFSGYVLEGRKRPILEPDHDRVFRRRLRQYWPQ